MEHEDMSFLETICEAMTDEIKNNFEKLFIAARNDEIKFNTLMDKLSTRINFTIDRKKIHWYPYINYDKCTHCKMCVQFCDKDVFVFNKVENKIQVDKQQNCIFLCKDCENACSNHAIVLPKRKEMLNYFYFK